VNLARFLHAEDPLHEVPSNLFQAPKQRPTLLITMEKLPGIRGNQH